MLHTLDEIMTISEAAERYGMKVETLKNKLKPSIAGEDKLNHLIELGLIRKSKNTWLLTVQFMDNIKYKEEI